MGIAEKEGGLLDFDTDNLNFFFFPTAEIIAQLQGEISMHIPATQGLTSFSHEAWTGHITKVLEQSKLDPEYDQTHE